MTLLIRKSNGQIIPLADRTVDLTYSVSLFGQSVSEYDANVAQSLYQLHENFASVTVPEQNTFINFNNETNQSSQPAQPVTGQLWYDKVEERLKVYNEEEGQVESGWTQVFPETTTLSLEPITDSEQDIGDPLHYWHNIYATHGFFNTNRFSNQLGINDPDLIDSVIINGYISMGNDATGYTYIDAEDGHFGQLGDVDKQLNTVYTDKILLGDNVSAGIRLSADDQTNLVPYSPSGEDLTIGAAFKPFNEIVTNLLYTNNIGGLGNSLEVTLSAGITILPETDDTMDIATASDIVKEVSVDNLYSTRMTVNSNATFSASDGVCNEIYARAFDNVPNGTPTRTDKMVVESDDGSLKKISVNDFLPVGFIIMWGLSDSDIPVDWRICNGLTYLDGVSVDPNTLNAGQLERSVYTPNLSDRFPFAVGSSSDIEETGTTNTVITDDSSTAVDTSDDGAHAHGGQTQEHVLTANELPAHTHDYVQRRGNNRNNQSGAGGAGESLGDGQTSFAGGDGGHRHTINEEPNHNHTTEGGGHDHTFDMTNAKVYKIIHIMKVL